MNQSGLIYGNSEEKIILAKKEPQFTLDDHVRDCMLVLKLLKEVFPSISVITKRGNYIWLDLFIAVFFHDTGKGVEGFQKMMRSPYRYKFRHERLSGAIFDNILISNLPPEIKEKILRVIIMHHKLYEKMKSIINSELILDDDDFTSIFDSEDIISFNSEWKNVWFEQIKDYITGWNKYVEAFLPEYAGQYSIDTEKINECNDILRKTLDDILKQDILDEEAFYQLILWGLLKNCDHMGSARISQMPTIQSCHQEFLRKLCNPYKHQTKCWNESKNVLLIAPTGSGKTEAAFGWAFKEINDNGNRHIFYVLPYTASINAMFYRLNRDIDNKKEASCEDTVVGLLHGKIRQFLTDSFDDEDCNEIRIKSLTNIYKMIIKPIKITTPFQILKYLFGVKGFEKGLIELAGAVLIYDEIHAYDKELFLKILWSLEWLQKHMKVKVFVTTATLPSFLQDLIMQVLKIESPIKPDRELLESFTRHSVRLLEGNIEENEHLIADEIKKMKKILIVCNTVDKAQAIFRKLSYYVTEDEIALIHSRFAYKDRVEIEKSITDENSQIRVLIGTQAIEVSLDIDYDILFSEPAPLDALLQRFGRINRKRLKGICPVYVFMDGGEYDYKIYDRETVEKTLEVLKEIQINFDGVIYEDKLQDMMNKVYTPWDIEDFQIQMWKKDFYSMMDSLLPYKEHRITEEQFESQFLGIEVLPRYYYEEYLRLIEEGRIIQAETLICQLNKSKLYNPKVKEHLKKVDSEITHKNDLWLIDCKYSPKQGLLFSESEIIDNFI